MCDRNETTVTVAAVLVAIAAAVVIAFTLVVWNAWQKQDSVLRARAYADAIEEGIHYCDVMDKPEWWNVRKSRIVWVVGSDDDARYILEKARRAAINAKLAANAPPPSGLPTPSTLPVPNGR